MMETLEKIQTRHKAILRTFDSVLSALAPVTFDNKCYFVDDVNIERLAKQSEFLSNDFCGVCVTSEKVGQPGQGNQKTLYKVKIEGQDFGYEIDPNVLPRFKKNVEKSFKEVELFTKRQPIYEDKPEPEKPVEVKIIDPIKEKKVKKIVTEPKKDYICKSENNWLNSLSFYSSKYTGNF